MTKPNAYDNAAAFKLDRSMPDLTEYDVILVNTSAGKDSQAMLDYVYEAARAVGVEDRVQAVHADLGRMEWAGTKQLAQRQCDHYGVELHVCIRRDKTGAVGSDLLGRVRERGMWPSNAQRWCTSDFKRTPCSTVITALARAAKKQLGRAPRVLNCMGLRSQESAARANCPSCKGHGKLNAETGKALSKKALKAGAATVTCPRCNGEGERVAYERDPRQSNSAKTVDTWLPIHDWTEAQVWGRIKVSGVEHHRAYDLGMPRLSCVFCIFAPKAALVVAGRENRALLDEYVKVEAEVGHSFKNDMRIAEVAEAVDAGEQVRLDGTWGPQ